MPNGILFLIISISPIVILKIDTDALQRNQQIRWKRKQGWRGGAQLNKTIIIRESFKIEW